MADTALHRISKKRFGNEKKFLNDPAKALHYATAFPSEKPGEELVWYFLIMGDDDSSYKGGQYIGKIIHNKSYPAKPPDYVMLTPNGRYDIDRKICLSNSSYHSGEWSSSWNIITILIAFASIWYDDKESGISHTTHVSKEKRQEFARQSLSFNAQKYSEISSMFNRTYLAGCAPKIIKTIAPVQQEPPKAEEKIKDDDTTKVKDDEIKVKNEENNDLCEEMTKISNNIEVAEIKPKKTKKSKIIKNDDEIDDVVSKVKELVSCDDSVNTVEKIKKTKTKKTKKTISDDL
jgi:ubiquitin-protein ligase